MSKKLAVTSQSSKAEEIEYLHKMAESCGDGSYLSSLFTGQFVTWIEEQIKNDFTVNIFEYYKQAEVEHSVALNHKARIENELATAKENMKISASVRNELQARIAKLENEKTAMADDWHKQIIRYIGEKNNLLARLDEAEKSITSLKAKLFDLITAGN